MSENLFGLTVAADKGLDDLQCQRLLSENRRYQEVMLQYRCALKALESRLDILNEEFSLQHDRNPFKNVSKTYKTGDVSVEALKDASFEIGKGEICVIVGQCMPVSRTDQGMDLACHHLNFFPASPFTLPQSFWKI